MRIECDNCHATYEVADNAIPPEGREVQCAKCDHVWLQMPPVAVELSESISAETSNADEGPSVETAEFEPANGTQQSVTEDVAGILESEADFARQQKEEIAPEEASGSPLENLRRRVISDNPDAMPPTDPMIEEPVFETEPAIEEAPEIPEELVAAADVTATEPIETPAVEETPEPAYAEAGADMMTAEPVMMSEGSTEDQNSTGQMEPTPSPEGSSTFRRLGQKPPTAGEDPNSPSEPPVMSAPEAEPGDPDGSAASAEPPAEPAPAAKPKRQSLAEISEGSAPKIEATELPASKPLDLGPAAPEERPETPLEQDVTRRTLEVPRSESIAKPDMSQEAVARRALEELDAINAVDVTDKRSMAGGFAIGLLVFVVLIFVYSFGPVLGEVIPGSAPIFDSYRAVIDSAFDAVGIDFSAIGRTLAGWLEAI